MRIQERLLSNRKDEWLSLSEAADLLGVHPSTLRRWADEGKLPVQRTAGGHRRFLRVEMELWSAAQRSVEPEKVFVMVQHAISRTRLELADGHMQKQAWYQKLSQSQKQRYRNGSRRLLNELARHADEENAAARENARLLGVDYAHMGRQAGLDLRHAIEAFQFFREFLMESIFNLYENAGVSSAHAWGEMRRRASRFTNRVLLSMVDAYLEDETS
jgi:excisionase family DNA binding protein